MYARVAGLPELRSQTSSTWILIDEVQKVPRLLNAVHDLIESKGIQFALTGSSARKLRRSSANLLAGRASIYHLFPLTSTELGDRFELQECLEWGSLPGIFGLTAQDRTEFLTAYTQTYLREEILEEQLVRKVAPFRKFLDFAALYSGQILNYSNFAHDSGTDPVSITSHFEILVDTLIGFDLGLKRALEGSLGQKLLPATTPYGLHFEHFVLQEIIRRASYLRKPWRYSYLRTKDDAEIDLIIEERGAPTLLVEIKSTTRLEERHLGSFTALAADFPNSRALCLSNDANPKRFGKVEAWPWRRGLAELGLPSHN